MARGGYSVETRTAPALELLSGATPRLALHPRDARSAALRCLFLVVSFPALGGQREFTFAIPRAAFPGKLLQQHF